MSAPVLVTGAAGFAGSHLVDLLSTAGARVHAWAHGHAVLPQSDDRTTWHAIDVLDREGVHQAIAVQRPSVVYHCAGIAQSSGAWTQIGATFEVNVRGTANLLAAVERHAADARVLVTSSALVYRHTGEPLDETSAIGPQGPYAVSKLAQDGLARHAAERGLDVVIARPFNHIGPRQSPDFVASSVARQIALAECGRVPPEIHVGNLSARRDFTDVRDVVRAYQLLAARGERGECYNVCSGRAVAVESIVRGLANRGRRPIAVVVDPARFRPVDVPVVVGSAGKLTQTTGWQPEVPLERTLDDLLVWWRGAVANEPA